MIRIILSSGLALLAVGGTISSLGHNLTGNDPLSSLQIVWAASVFALAFVEVILAIREKMNTRLGGFKFSVGELKISREERHFSADNNKLASNMEYIAENKQEKIDVENNEEIDISEITSNDMHGSKHVFDAPPTVNIATQARYFYAGLVVAVCAALSLTWALWRHDDLLRTFSLAGLSVGLAISTLALASAEQNVENFPAQDFF